jgi:hypothetical protein
MRLPAACASGLTCAPVEKLCSCHVSTSIAEEAEDVYSHPGDAVARPDCAHVARNGREHCVRAPVEPARAGRAIVDGARAREGRATGSPVALHLQWEARSRGTRRRAATGSRARGHPGRGRWWLVSVDSRARARASVAAPWPEPDVEESTTAVDAIARLAMHQMIEADQRERRRKRTARATCRAHALEGRPPRSTAPGS